VSYSVRYAASALKDLSKIKAAGLVERYKRVETQLAADPFAANQKFERLVPHSLGLYSRRIDRKNRVVYSVDAEHSMVTVYSAYEHYE
jgi:Txe/YoeB family toxin of toxin-antitoxin system